MTERVYITPQGATSLRAELQDLWKVKRPEVTRRVAAAAALGDRSENADYIYGKRQLREMDRRIRYLTKRLDNLEVVTRQPAETDRVFFGAWVLLENDEGELQRLRIVGADEFDPTRQWISIHSPVARALLGKRRGDEVVLTRPAGTTVTTIVGVDYHPPDGEPD